MKRFMQDLGDLTGLDIAAATRSAPVRDGATGPDANPAGGTAALARGALRWLGLASTDDGRCRSDGPPGMYAVALPAPRLH